MGPGSAFGIGVREPGYHGARMFSLAVGVYQMLLGKLSFEGECMAQLMFGITSGEPAVVVAGGSDMERRAHA